MPVHVNLSRLLLFSPTGCLHACIHLIIGEVGKTEKELLDTVVLKESEKKKAEVSHLKF